MPVNTSNDPFIADPSSLGGRVDMTHRNLQKKSPRELQIIHQESKLYKPFRSDSLRTLEAQLFQIGTGMQKMKEEENEGIIRYTEDSESSYPTVGRDGLSHSGFGEYNGYSKQIP